MEITDIKNMLKEIHFPINKQDLMGFADDKGLSGKIKDTLAKLPDKTFNGIEDVLSNLPGLSEVGKWFK